MLCVLNAKVWVNHTSTHWVFECREDDCYVCVCVWERQRLRLGGRGWIPGLCRVLLEDSSKHPSAWGYREADSGDNCITVYKGNWLLIVLEKVMVMIHTTCLMTKKTYTVWYQTLSNSTVVFLSSCLMFFHSLMYSLNPDFLWNIGHIYDSSFRMVISLTSMVSPMTLTFLAFSECSQNGSS